MPETKEQHKITFPKTVYHQEWGKRVIGADTDPDMAYNAHVEEYLNAKRDGWTDDDPHAPKKDDKAQHK